MLPSVIEYYRPPSIQEVVALLRERPDRRAALAGGTTLARSADPRRQGLVDLARLGLDGITDHPGGLFIGATATAARLASCERVRGLAGGLLSEAAAKLGSTPLRNRTTLGGNLMRGEPWTPLAPALLCLDAAAVLEAQQDRTLALEALLARGRPLDALSPGEILTGMIVPPAVAARRSAYFKLSRTSFDDSILDLAVAFVLDRGAMRGVRVAIGGSALRPRRSPAAEAALEGRVPSAHESYSAGRFLAAEAAPPGDYRASGAWLAKVIPVFLERAVRKAVGEDV